MENRGLLGQSAIEYLMTYGWMLLVVAIAGGAIFSIVGDQSIESVQGFDNNHIDVQDFGLSQESGLMFSMNDPLGQTEVKEVKISNPDTSNVSYILNQRVSEQNTVNLPGINPFDESGEIDVEVIYDINDLENLSATGAINGGLEVDENFQNRTIILDGIIGYWSFNEEHSENDELYDLTYNNNHGRKLNAPQTSEGLIRGNSIHFQSEEDNLIRVPDEEVYNLQEMTVSAWISFDNFGGHESDDSDYIKPIVSKSNTPFGGFSGREWDLLSDERESNERVTFNVFDGENSHNIHYSDINEGETYFLVGVVDESGSEFFINGERVGSESLDQIENRDNDINIGGVNGRDSIDGFIDEIRIYNHALSQNQIQRLYNLEG